MGKIMKILDKIGVKLFVLATLKEKSCEYFLLSFCLCMLCHVNVSALQIVFNSSLYENTTKWKTCQIFKEDRLLVHI
jgi:hypothetical protein